MRSTLNNLMLAAASALLAACSHTPTQESPAPAPIASEPVAAELANAPAAEPITEADALYAENETIIGPDTVMEPDTRSTAQVVADAVAEQNLIDRIRGGFAMSDAQSNAIDREVHWFARNPDYLDRTLRRAERYLFFIVEELEARQLPLELALLPIVESAFNPVALSRARAAGLWQFIPSTGRRYGLEQNHAYDGRRDVVESTRAALDYLEFLYGEFGDWHQAVAAYNSGEMNVTRAIARNEARGRPTDFFSLDLPRETRAYVPKLLALRRIVAEPEKFGLEFGHIANQPYFAKVELTAPVDLGVAAHLANLPKEDLIALNPAHRRAVTGNDGPGFLLVPVDRADALRTGLAELSPTQRVPKVYYTVHRGDTISTVSRKLGVTQDELRAANKLKGNTLRVGQELVLNRGAAAINVKPAEPTGTERFVTRDPNFHLPPPPPRTVDYSPTHRVRNGETLWSIARTYGVSLDALAKENNLASSQRIARGQKLWIPKERDDSTATLATIDARDAAVPRISYTVRAGDTLSRIATKFRVKVSELMSWNKLRDANSIRVGQKLVLFTDTQPGG